ncbi:MAG: hypothetical protein AcusKO_06770 [Acuticoccus sp.]
MNAQAIAPSPPIATGVLTADAYFPVLLETIRRAGERVDIATYLFTHDLRQPDCRGRLVSDALCRAAARGVAVRVVVGRSQSARLTSLNSACARVLARGGVSVALRQPGAPPLHDKFALFDGTIAAVGGPNLTHTGLSSRGDLVVLSCEPDCCKTLGGRFEALLRDADKVAP